DRRQDVALRGGIIPRDETDTSRNARQRALPLRREQTLVCQLPLQPLERREVVAETERLEREGAQAEITASLVEIGTSEHVHAVPVRQVESQRVEARALDGHAEARAVGRILEREEHRLP